jgi:hypothetical protein
VSTAQAKPRWTSLSRMNAPIRSGQIRHLVEVAVSGNQDQAVTLRHGGNPEVVLGERTTLLLQLLLQPSVFASNNKIAWDNDPASSKLLNFSDVLSGPAGLRGSEEQLADYNRWDEYFGCPVQIGQHCVVPLEQSNDDSGVE